MYRELFLSPCKYPIRWWFKETQNFLTNGSREPSLLISLWVEKYYSEEGEGWEREEQSQENHISETSLELRGLSLPLTFPPSIYMCVCVDC